MLYLSGPRGTIGQGADGVALDLLRDLPQLLNLGRTTRLAMRPPMQDVIHPADALATWRALTTALVLVELHQTPDTLDWVVVLNNYFKKYFLILN